MGTYLRQRVPLRFFREIALVGMAYLAYEAVRAVAADRVADALGNTFHIVRAEQALGIFAELNIQLAVLSVSLVTSFLSLWYFWGHFPLIILFAVWALYRHPADYRWARNAIFISGGIALIVYVLFPVAPPRLTPGSGFVDTLKDVTALQYEDNGFVNQFAAVPSMHQGFALILGATLFRIFPGRRGWLWLVGLPGLMFVSIVATGNHWILDAVLGLCAAVLGMMAATRLECVAPRLRDLALKLLPRRTPREVQRTRAVSAK